MRATKKKSLSPVRLFIARLIPLTRIPGDRPITACSKRPKNGVTFILSWIDVIQLDHRVKQGLRRNDRIAKAKNWRDYLTTALIAAPQKIEGPQTWSHSFIDIFHVAYHGKPKRCRVLAPLQDFGTNSLFAMNGPNHHKNIVNQMLKKQVQETALSL